MEPIICRYGKVYVLNHVISVHMKLFKIVRFSKKKRKRDRPVERITNNKYFTLIVAIAAHVDFFRSFWYIVKCIFHCSKWKMDHTSHAVIYLCTLLHHIYPCDEHIVHVYFRVFVFSGKREPIQ